MDSPEPRSFTERFAKPAAKATAKPRSQADQLIARNPQLVHKITAKDTNGNPAYYVIYVQASRERAFLEALSGKGIIDLEDYGRILASCFGNAPDEKTKAFLKETYGFEV
jgi:hypothetical protein